MSTEFKGMHGLIIHGPQGSGKTTLAKNIAEKLGPKYQINDHQLFDNEIVSAPYNDDKLSIIIIDGPPMKGHTSAWEAVLKSGAIFIKCLYSRHRTMHLKTKFIFCVNHLDEVDLKYRKYCAVLAAGGQP